MGRVDELVEELSRSMDEAFSSMSDELARHLGYSGADQMDSVVDARRAEYRERRSRMTREQRKAEDVERVRQWQDAVMVPYWQVDEVLARIEAGEEVFDE